MGMEYEYTRNTANKNHTPDFFHCKFTTTQLPPPPLSERERGGRERRRKLRKIRRKATKREKKKRSSGKDGERERTAHIYLSPLTLSLSPSLSRPSLSSLSLIEISSLKLLLLCFPVRWPFRRALMVAPYSAAVICLCLRIRVRMCACVCVRERVLIKAWRSQCPTRPLLCARSIASHTEFQKRRDFFWANLGHAKCTYFSTCYR